MCSSHNLNCGILNFYDSLIFSRTYSFCVFWFTLCILGRTFVHFFGLFVGCVSTKNIEHIETQNFQCLGLCWMANTSLARCEFWMRLVFCMNGGKKIQKSMLHTYSDQLLHTNS